MDLHEKKSCLREIDLFQSFSEAELTEFASHVNKIKLNCHEVLFKEGEQGVEIFILLDGQVDIYKEDRFITQIVPIDYLGEMAVIEDRKRSATAVAASDITLLRVSANLFQQFMQKSPQALSAILKTLSARIRLDTALMAKEFQRANVLIHDMRNRLSAFVLLDLIESTKLDQKNYRYLEVMRNSCHDLNIMMDEALANAKHLKFQRQQDYFSINDLICDLNNSDCTVHPALHDKNIVLKLADDLPKCCCSEVEIRRVLTNLLINAGQAATANSTIIITSENRQEQIEIKVKDHGTGIPEAIQDKVFKANFTTKKDGSGLGLTSCHEIVELNHHGKLSFTSSTTGTTFTITLPIHKDI